PVLAADCCTGPDGIAVAANAANPSQPPFAFVNNNDGTITKFDLSTSPATNVGSIASGGSRGDFVAVGPDGCLYATQTDRVVKVTNADGTCSLIPTSAAPQLSLAPTIQSVAVASLANVTATFRNVASPSGLPVTFT